MTVAFSDTNLLCDMLRPLPTFANKVTINGACRGWWASGSPCFHGETVSQCTWLLGPSRGEPALPRRCCPALLARAPSTPPAHPPCPSAHPRRCHLCFLRAPQAAERHHQHPGQCAVPSELQLGGLDFGALHGGGM